MNLWHGLSPSNVVAFERLEPDLRRKIREKLQIEVLDEVNPDILFLQEVNPVTTRFQDLCKQLNRHGAFQPDLVGVKVFGYGFPLHLFSGLVVLTRASWPIRKVGAFRLSGPPRSFVHRWASFQLQEERYALFCETERAGMGRILLVNTHLHHGLEANDAFQEKITAVMEELALSSAARSELRDRMEAGNERRSREITVLLRELERVQKDYALIILGGDFNCEPAGEVGARLRELGFSDVWHASHPNEAGFTFDRSNNLANHILQDRFPLTFMVEDLSFDSKTKERLLKLAIEQERRPRRIDQIWVRAEGEPPAVSAELVGFPDKQGLAPSDHFGLVSRIELK